MCNFNYTLGNPKNSSKDKITPLMTFKILQSIYLVTFIFNGFYQINLNIHLYPIFDDVLHFFFFASLCGSNFGMICEVNKSLNYCYHFQNVFCHNKREESTKYGQEKKEYFFLLQPCFLSL